ncbi:divalent metal cation transporter [Rhodopirellula sp. JC639]|uniref:divalent metal cation transporter n=1 Tax=Stieleria mannarensis TaxID=2755585 RepID=UPI001602EA09|nr:divalent metal cation transporter [Rhodopirellula sp. JC639]
MTDQPSPVSDAPAASTPQVSEKVLADRKLLLDAQESGKTLSTYVRLSGPGWLQAAITLGGGSLAGALFLGVLGGTSMLWLQLLAITMGVIMLSAISYVTLSTGRRPFEAINSEINPALGWGWIIATAMANIIWCMPQFSLCYDAIDKNLANLAGGGGLGDATSTKIIVTIVLFLAAGFVVLLNTKQGRAAKLFDIVLKSLVGMVVICFFGVVALLAINGELEFGGILAGFIPDLSQWNNPAGEMTSVVASLGQTEQTYWTSQLVSTQRSVMIAAAATAVGINMTFLLPYSMLARGWDKPFRGLARFDLSTGMAIPYVVVTSCVVIASAFSLHNKIDDSLASNDLATMQQSPYYNGVEPILLGRVDHELGAEAAESMSMDEKLERVAALSVEEKRVALSLVKRNAFQLSGTLEPLLGQSLSNLVFGLGVFGMGFSTIVILMLINGYAFREMMGQPDGAVPFVIGCLVAGLSGATWWYLWDGEAKFWLAIFASTFGMMLLPIAYVTFFLMMNNKRILGAEKPTGGRMVAWNVLMLFAVIGATVAAVSAISEKANDPKSFPVIIGLIVVYGIAVVIGFVKKRGEAVAG